MDIQIREAGSVTVVEITGRLGSGTAGDLQVALGELMENGRTRIVADLHGVDYISSVGLRTIFSSMKEAHRHGGDFRLAAVRPEVYRFLEISGFTSILKIFDEASTAVVSFDAD